MLGSGRYRSRFCNKHFFGNARAPFREVASSMSEVSTRSGWPRLLNRRIATKHDHRVAQLQFSQLRLLLLLNFQIVGRGISPAGNVKEANFSAFAIHKFAFVTSRLHLAKPFSDCYLRLFATIILDNVIRADIVWQTG